VTDCTGGLLVVGIFPTENDANAWIDADSRMTQLADYDDSSLFLRRA
jgi:hypothetical protein